MTTVGLTLVLCTILVVAMSFCFGYLAKIYGKDENYGLVMGGVVGVGVGYLLNKKFRSSLGKLDDIPVSV